jgi:hypothetical protein
LELGKFEGLDVPLVIPSFDGEIQMINAMLTLISGN